MDFLLDNIQSASLGMAFRAFQEIPRKYCERDREYAQYDPLHPHGLQCLPLSIEAVVADQIITPCVRDQIGQPLQRQRKAGDGQIGAAQELKQHAQHRNDGRHLPPQQSQE